MIKLTPLLEQHEVNKKRIKLAFLFFIKYLKLTADRISLKYGTLTVDPQSKLPVQANVFVTREVPHKYIVTMRNNNPMSNDEQIRHLAHEMKHIEQIESGRFDVYANSWDGKVYPNLIGTPEYQGLPWERDARMSVMELEKEFNRYMRERGSSKKIIKRIKS